MKKGKLVAPVVITALLVLYYSGFAAACILLAVPLILRALGCLIPLALAGVAIFVCYERYKEIRSGEEDDLSQY